MLQRFTLLCCTLWMLTAASAAASEAQLVLPGTGDSQTLLEVLARAFEEQNPEVRIEVPTSVGTIGGIRRVLAGEVPFSRTARPLSEQERQHGLQQKVFAYSPIVFVANLESACLENLTARQVVGIYSGRVTSWAQLGDCPQKKIYVANREDGDSSRRVLVEKVPGFAAIDPFAGEVLYSNPENQRILEQYPQTIGYMPLANAIKSSLRFFRYEGTPASMTAVQKGQYPLTVPLGIAWKGELQGPARAFVDFLFSSKGRALITENGAVPAALLPEPAKTGTGPQ